MIQKPSFVIVQAGGRGSRCRHHTWNKPKCLVSVNGKPLIYHLFEKFNESKFIIIGDYLFDVLEKYLQVNPPKISFELIRTNEKGTCSGIDKALYKIPKNKSLLITWSDVIISKMPNLSLVPGYDDRPIIFTTSSFTCRWSISEKGLLNEFPSTTHGIPGIFFFSKTKFLPSPPPNGEFVRWFSNTIKKFSSVNCDDLEELGDFENIEISNEKSGFSRFFNKVEIFENKVIKTVLDKNFSKVHENEVNWYGEVSKLNFKRIPKIFSTNPLTLEKIKGKHLFQINDLNHREHRSVLVDYIESLNSLHEKMNKQSSIKDLEKVYIDKTIERVKSVSDLIPGFNSKSMTINGKKCKNIFFEDSSNFLQEILPYILNKNFSPIHGDPTFSNTIIDSNLKVWFIDPRGYFAENGIFGDPFYDFAKLYYSAIGGYDLFNRRKFKLHIDDTTVEVLIEPPKLMTTSEDIFREYFQSNLIKIKLIHSLIWLSFAGYTKDDLDSIIASFYLGLYWFENAQLEI